MALLLTRDDLRPFFEDIGSLELCMAAVLEAYAAPAVAVGSPLLRLTVATGAPIPATVTVSSTPLHGALVQLRPRPEQAPPPDTRIALYAREGRVVAILSVEGLDLVRVAVPSAIACRYLAPRETRVLAVLGSGIQGHAHARALRHTIAGLTEVRIYSPDPVHRGSLARSLSATEGPPVHATGSAHEAIDGADVIAATALSDVPVFDAASVRPGALIVSIARGQLPPALAGTTRIFAVTTADSDARRETRARDTSAPLAAAWTRIDPVGTLTDVIAGRVPPRLHDRETVLHMQMGLPGVEAAIADRAYRWAREHAGGRDVGFS